MKYICVLVLSLTLLPGYGQLKNKLGTINDFDRNIKECAFDDEAAAVVLVDEGASDYTESYELITWRYKKIKILKEAGIERADLVLDYQSGNNMEDVIAVDVLVTNFDENGTFTQHKVDKKGIYRSKLDETWSRVSVPVPQVKVGSIIEYSYRVIGKHYGMLRDWHFQQDIPVYKSFYNLRIVPNLEMTYLVQYNQNFQLNVVPNKVNNSVSFEMKDLPALTDEPYMDARKDYIQKVIFQITKITTSSGTKNYMSNWHEVYRELSGRPDFGRQTKVNIGECSAFISSLTGKSDYEKMQMVYTHVQKNSQWDGHNALVSKKGAKDLWKDRTGNSADINLTLVNLLNEAGLTAYPMLVSERGHGKVNKTIPFIDQFNSVYAAVFINDRKYYLDATDKHMPAHLTPTSILNTTAFIVSGKNGGLVDIEEKDTRAKEVIAINATLKDNGEFAGTVQTISGNYSRTLRNRYRAKTKPEEYIAEHILHGIGNVKVDSLRFENEEVDTLDLKQKFSYATNVQSTGEYSFVSLNMFSGFEQNPFVIKHRFSNINFGYNRSTFISCAISLPEHHAIDALPKDIRMKNPDGSVVFAREIFHDRQKKMLVARIRVEINKSLFTVEEYPALQEFYKQMINLMNEQVVLKKI